MVGEVKQQLKNLWIWDIRAYNTEDLNNVFYNVMDKTFSEVDPTDDDKDGVPDVCEVIGMQLINGQIVTSDPTKKDTDNDDLSDLEEIGKYKVKQKISAGINTGVKIIFKGQSDPRKPDSDGDGIKDKDDLRRLEYDSIETMFKLSSKNNINNPLYITINKNDVEVTAYVRFLGDANDVYTNSNNTCATILADAIEDFWNVSIDGNKDDFLTGIKGRFKINVIYEVPGESYYTRPEQKYLYIRVDNDNPDLWDVVSKYVSGSGGHVSNLDGKYTYENWSMKNQSLVTMYRMYQNRDGSTDLYSEDTYRLVVAHEFGHMLGLADAYFRDSDGEYYCKETSEVPIDDIMRQGKWPYSVKMNDLEMVLKAFEENKFQYFYDMGNGREKSSVIRQE